MRNTSFKISCTNIIFFFVELVHHITQRFILPTLKGLCSAILYMGSNYEFTTVPGSSDYDIQFCIEIPKTKHNHVKTSSAMADGCGDPAWRKIKGGPENLLDDKGYLSTSKVTVRRSVKMLWSNLNRCYLP